MSAPSVIEQILELARWAPSGDNEQGWRFALVNPQQVRVHCQDTRDHCVYDLDGHSSQIAFGALLETIRIAASAHGWRADAERVAGCADAAPVFEVRFAPQAGLAADPLIAAIEKRSVQRRPMRTRPLTAVEKQALQASLGAGYEVQWIEGWGGKWRAARLMFRNAKLRLTMPEAYEVHRKIIQWNARFSLDRVPDQALGVDKMTLRLMRWGMQSWRRLARVNAVLGTWAPWLQMDFLPGLACAAHFVIKSKREPASLDDYVAAGREVQRFWLSLTLLGLAMQPEMTPLIFSRYVSKGLHFSRLAHMQPAAAALQQDLLRLTGDPGAGFPVYMGRLGAGPQPRARSLRRPLHELMLPPVP